MADQGAVPTAEELTTWLMPRDALTRVSRVVGTDDLAADAIIRRLQGGALTAAAKSSTSEVNNRAAPQRSITLIPPEYWRVISRIARRTEFWQVGDVRFFFDGSGGRVVGARVASRSDVFAPTMVAVTFFGVRIDRTEFDRWLADLVAPDAQQSATVIPTPAAEGPEAPRGLPVSQEHLRAWYELYQSVYAGSAHDTEAAALKSVLGMFPGKSVSRDRVRELRGAQKVGRKPRA
jgi:hypothetical protein